MSRPNPTCLSDCGPWLKKGLRYCDSWNFLGTRLFIVLGTVYPRAHGIFLHQPGIEGLEAVRYESRFGNTRIQPKIVVLRLQDHGHAIVYVGHKRVGSCRQDGACFQELASRISPTLP